MKPWIAFWNIIRKDMLAYYLKPPNISWGLIFPIAWTGMFFIRSGSGFDSIMSLLPGVVAISILFGTTSMLAVTVTFEKKAVHLSVYCSLQFHWNCLCLPRLAGPSCLESSTPLFPSSWHYSWLTSHKFPGEPS